MSNISVYKALPVHITLHNSNKPYVLLSGGAGSGKTYAALGEILRLATKYPENRIAIIRKNLSDIKKSILVTFERLIPNEWFKKTNINEMKYTLYNNTVIQFLDASTERDPRLEKIRGTEFGAVLIDEASQVAPEVFDICKTRLRWLCKNNIIPQYRIILTTNPEPGTYLESLFLKNQHPDYLMLHSTVDDNPYAPESYKEELRKLPEHLRRKFYSGIWENIIAPDSLIQYDWIKRSYNLEYEPGIKSLGVDVARYGLDSEVFALMDGNTLIQIFSYPKSSITFTASKIKELIILKNIFPDNVAVDTCGVGGGVLDILYEQGLKVKEVISQAKPINIGKTVFQFADLHSQIYWKLSEMLKDGLIHIGIPESKERQNLVQELCSFRYSILKDKKLYVEHNDEIKKRLGRSPDFADAFANAVYAQIGYSTIGKATAFIVDDRVKGSNYKEHNPYRQSWRQT